jgi:hypothetical protein
MYPYASYLFLSFPLELLEFEDEAGRRVSVPYRIFLVF